jgi:transposase InsO family protein
LAGGRVRTTASTSWCTTPTAVQYLSIRYTERVSDAGGVQSVGSRGDSYDNALAESLWASSPGSSVTENVDRNRKIALTWAFPSLIGFCRVPGRYFW